MRLSQFASRSYPRTVSYAHLRACCLCAFTATIMDDYYELCTADEIEMLRQQVTGIFRGNQPGPEDNGILQQMAVARDALLELMPAQWMQRVIAHIDDYIGKGMKAECPYILQRQLHNEELEEFITLQDQLPDFGTYETAVRNYIYHLALMVQGERAWYMKDTPRYAPGGYAEPEYRR